MFRFLSALLSAALVAGLAYIFLAPVQRAVDRTIKPPRDIVEIRERVTPQMKAAYQNAGLTWGAPVHLRVFKEERVLELWVAHADRFELFRSYDICNHSGALGPKLAEGDRQSPEGFYRVDSAAMNPNSSYHLSFNLGFPNAYDRGQDRTGSFLMIHGDCVSVGCYAMTDAGIEEIYLAVEAAHREGQGAVDVHAFPFRMTPARMAQAEGHRWFGFWTQLHAGYQAFERSQVPPRIDVSQGRYVVR